MTAADRLPVARVLVEVPLAHLDRPFDYLVPEAMLDTAVPGCRVRVRFAGKDVEGFVLERVESSDHSGRLAPLRRVVSPEPVLLPEIADLAGRVAERWAGTRSDVLRLAVPPRHARVEQADRPPRPAPASYDVSGARLWSHLDRGAEFVAALAGGGAPRAVWTEPAGTSWPDQLAVAAAATLASGRGAVLCVPDRRDLARLDAALTARLGAGHHVILAADAGPAARYRAFLAVARGDVRVVAGTRSAAFAPAHDLGLVAIWDDGDDLYAEPRAPYPHTREVLLLRAEQQGCAVLVGAHGRSVEADYLVSTGWAREIAASREEVRARAQVAVAGTSAASQRDPFAFTARLPSEAHALIREALATGPVLVQVPRAGYATGLACERCRARATCRACQGPLALPGPAMPPTCRWCGGAEPAWACEECGHRGLRAPVVGDLRTVEEVGRSFPGVVVRSSAGDHVLASVSGDPQIVVATPGAEPVAEGGYAAVVLLDAWLMLGRADLRVDEEALRRWLNAAALVRPAGEGGRVLVVGDPGQRSVQALVRWDPAGLARREAEERRAAHLPPAARMASLVGPAEAVDDALSVLALPPGAEVLGPVAVRGGPESEADLVRMVVRVPRRAGLALAHGLREMQAGRSARKLPVVRVHLDPPLVD